MPPVKARVWGSILLLVAGCAALSGCYSGLNGAAVAGGAPPVKSSAQLTATGSGTATSLVPNGSFDDGTSPWQPTPSSQIAVTRKLHWDSKQALLIQPTQAVGIKHRATLSKQKKQEAKKNI